MTRAIGIVELLVSLWIVLSLLGAWALGYLMLHGPRSVVRRVTKWIRSASSSVADADDRVYREHQRAMVREGERAVRERGREAMRGEVIQP